MNTVTNRTRTSYEQQLAAASAELPDMDSYNLISLGPAGSNCHIVARDLAVLLGRDRGEEPTVTLCRDFPGILSTSEGIDNGVSIVPLVNTVGGNVRHRPDQLPTNKQVISEKNGVIVANIELPIEHCLIGAESLDLGDIEGWSVHSHPQALRQCDGLIDELGLDPIEAPSTSSAVQALTASQLGSKALAIAPALASELYGASVIASDIGNTAAAHNLTTMAVVVRGGNI
ncbi:MAG: prephenate dehydratase domain-containing protein [Patescibacteria group bacterium]